jgi:hypothetical protein
MLLQHIVRGLEGSWPLLGISDENRSSPHITHLALFIVLHFLSSQKLLLINVCLDVSQLRQKLSINKKNCLKEKDSFFDNLRIDLLLLN